MCKQQARFHLCQSNLQEYMTHIARKCQFREINADFSYRLLCTQSPCKEYLSSNMYDAHFQKQSAQQQEARDSSLSCSRKGSAPAASITYAAATDQPRRRPLLARQGARNQMGGGEEVATSTLEGHMYNNYPSIFVMHRKDRQGKEGVMSTVKNDLVSTV